MASIFVKIINKLTAVITYPYHQNLYRKHTIERFAGSGEKHAIVNLDNQLWLDDNSRYFYAICIFLEKAGFKVVVKTNLLVFKKSRRPNMRNYFLGAVWKEDYVYIRNCSNPLNTVVLVQPGAANHVMRFVYGHNVVQSGRFDCIAPYPMQPFQYKHSVDGDGTMQPERPGRTIRVFFAGKTHKTLYAKERVKAFFDVIPRLEVIEFVLSRFSERTRLLQNEPGRLVLQQLLALDRPDNGIIISEVKTENEDWFKILAKTEFFICPPGARMPWCHNSIEAMSRGTIPILEYADLFYPALQDGKNCLSYTGFEELESAINKALAMDVPAIAEMRKAVLQYYNDHLSIQSITEKMSAFSKSDKEELTVAIPFVPTMQERRSIPSGG